MTIQEYLKYLECNLDIPYPARRDFLSEIESHLDDFIRNYREKGFSKETAIEKAISELAMNQEILKDLDEVHAPMVLTGLIGTFAGYIEAFHVAPQLIQKEGSFPIWFVSEIALSTSFVGMLVALFTLVIWYVLSAKAERIEHMRVS